jgi:hypothetical protein
MRVLFGFTRKWLLSIFVIRQDCIKQFIKNWKMTACENVVWHVLEKGSAASKLYVFGWE